MNFVEIKFDCVNFWGNDVYRTKHYTPIVHLKGEGYYTLTDNRDIDSDPYHKIKDDCIKIVNEFNDEQT